MSMVLFLVLSCVFFTAIKPAKQYLKARTIQHDAYHEAGHVVLLLALGYGFDTVSVGIDVTGDRGQVKPHEDSFDTSFTPHAEDLIKVAVAGVIASSIKFVGKHADEGYSDQLLITKALATKPHLTQGNEVEYLRVIRREVKSILLQNITALDAIATLLAKNRILSELEVTAMLEKSGIAFPLSHAMFPDDNQ